MSDNMRKDLSDQVGEKVKPDSQKSYTEVASEKVTGAADKVAGTVQPESEKSTTQKIGDSTRSNADQAQNQGASYVEQAQKVVGDIAQSVSDTIIGTTDNAKAKTEDATKST